MNVFNHFLSLPNAPKMKSLAQLKSRDNIDIYSSYCKRIGKASKVLSL